MTTTFKKLEEAFFYVAVAMNSGILLLGWHCRCGCFNGTAKEFLRECRACGGKFEDVVRHP